MKCRRRTRMKHQKKQARRMVRRKHRSSERIRVKSVAPRTAEEFFTKPKAFQDRWTRASHVISKMRRDGASLIRASREFGVASRAVRKLAGQALRKRANGRYAAKASDRLLRVFVIPTIRGMGEIAVRDSRQASQLAKYWNAVQRYLQTGDAFAIRQFDGKRITDASGAKIRLLTDLKDLDRLTVC